MWRLDVVSEVYGRRVSVSCKLQDMVVVGNKAMGARRLKWQQQGRQMHVLYQNYFALGMLNDTCNNSHMHD